MEYVPFPSSVGSYLENFPISESGVGWGGGAGRGGVGGRGGAGWGGGRGGAGRGEGINIDTILTSLTQEKSG